MCYSWVEIVSAVMWAHILKYLLPTPLWKYLQMLDFRISALSFV